MMAEINDFNYCDVNKVSRGNENGENMESFFRKSIYVQSPLS